MTVFGLEAEGEDDGILAAEDFNHFLVRVAVADLGDLGPFWKGGLGLVAGDHGHVESGVVLTCFQNERT